MKRVAFAFDVVDELDLPALTNALSKTLSGREAELDEQEVAALASINEIHQAVYAGVYGRGAEVTPYYISDEN
jgi:hypothetical protein